MKIIEFISQPWHWAISGAMITFVMFLLIYLGKRFGVSSSYPAMCAIGGADNRFDYFKNYSLDKYSWLLTFIVGTMIGGWIASHFLASPLPVQISDATVSDLAALGVYTPKTTAEGSGMLPLDVFNFESLLTLKGFIIMILGGFMVGFGTRWAGGCTSGHAITGLSNLQLPSLVAVIGFFIGGLVMTHLLFPFLFSL